jgi:hypothetical protein
MSIPIRVLIVEDSADDAELMLGNLATTALPRKRSGSRPRRIFLPA